MSAPAVALVHAGESLGKPIGDVVRFREQLRVVEIEILHEAGVAVGARFMASGAAQLGFKFEDQAIVECAALTIEDIRADRHLPQLVTLGVGFVFAEAKSLEALKRCEAVLERFKIHLPTETVGGFYLYVRSGEGTNISISSRMFPPIDGIGEDPATGSAAAMLGALRGVWRPTLTTLPWTSIKASRWGGQAALMSAFDRWGRGDESWRKCGAGDARRDQSVKR